MTLWVAVLVTSFCCLGWKIAGMCAPARLLDRPEVRRFAELVPIALLAGLTAAETLSTGRHLVIDGRLAGLVAAGLALLLRLPFLAVVGAAAVVAGCWSLLGWG
jgi:hypothetical protein